jgi:hypothetical protein
MAHIFSFDLPDDATAALAKASTTVQEAGGSFSGDMLAGTFAGKTPVGQVKGSYRVAGRMVTVTITDKPFVLSKSLVESKVRSFFGV